jgi:chromatin structure-remodeling complex subunit RSC1/2
MYQHLTSSALNAVPAMTRASFNFSSVSAGPGNDDPAKLKLLEAAPSARSNNKDRDSLDTVTYKGSDYQLGDYVHLVNPDDASKPIVGQIYRVFVQPS